MIEEPIESGFTRNPNMPDTTGWEQREDKRGVYWCRPAEVAQEIRHKLEELRLQELINKIKP